MNSKPYRGIAGQGDRGGEKHLKPLREPPETVDRCAYPRAKDLGRGENTRFCKAPAADEFTSRGNDRNWP